MEAVKSNPNNTYEMVLKGAMSIPGVRIDRETFLFSELKKYYDTDVVQNAIENNPAYAGIDEAVIDRIATESITFETNKVSAISFAAGMPGGFVMLGTAPAYSISPFFTPTFDKEPKYTILYFSKLGYDYSNKFYGMFSS